MFEFGVCWIVVVSERVGVEDFFGVKPVLLKRSATTNCVDYVEATPDCLCSCRSCQKNVEQNPGQLYSSSFQKNASEVTRGISFITLTFHSLLYSHYIFHSQVIGTVSNVLFSL